MIVKKITMNVSVGVTVMMKIANVKIANVFKMNG
tara:strand:- start:124 stop:225 length:102 start_codon:yes stop_codon:yes gene_type:complete